VRLTAVHRVIETTSRAATLTGALDALVAGTRETLDSDVAAVLLVEDADDGPILVTRAVRALSADFGVAARVPLGRGVVGRLAAQGRAVIVDDPHELDGIVLELGMDGIASFIIVPIVDEGRLLGVLHAASRTSRSFSAQDRELTDLIAAGVGATIARARLADALLLYRQQLETQTSELEATASELELTVQALRRANAELAATAESARAAQIASEAANRAKSAFLATMSHELRTPLNAILGYASLLLDGLAGELLPAQRDFMERTRASGRHLLGLVEEVLDIAKVEAGQMRVEMGPVSALRVITAAVTLLRPQAASAGVDVDATACTDTLGEVTGDERRVRQILLNLLANAVKFTRPGGRISVSCQRVAGHAPFAPTALGSWMCLSVADTGSGMPPDVLARVFEPFFTTKDVGKGSGLGLPQVYGFAQQSGGRVRVDSEVGVGTVVTLLLPRSLRQPATSVDASGASRVRGDDAHRGEVLLVEDDPEVAALTQEMLSHLGFTVIHAASPAAARTSTA